MTKQIIYERPRPSLLNFLMDFFRSEPHIYYEGYIDKKDVPITEPIKKESKPIETVKKVKLLGKKKDIKISEKELENIKKLINDI